MLANLNDVHLAIEHEELVPYFQPLIELRTGRLAGFEVLARWQHPQLGLILPQNFITLAEENGLVGKLMQQILRKACMSSPALPEPLVLAVNVSPIQLRDASLPAQVREATAETGFPLERLLVEITESAFVDNLEQARKITEELKAMGCKLALDDFGTGYSSLSHLQTMPFDELKIDRTFVSSMTTARESRKIVASVIGLGHSIGLATVAEGVETDEQAEMLLWLGCELAQGWLYGRPSSAEQIPAIVAAAPRKLSSRLSTQGDESLVSSLEAHPAQRLAMLQAIYDGSPVGLCFLDNHLRYVSMNKRLAEMNGPSVADHLGKTPQEVVPYIFSLYEPYLRRALNGESISGVEVRRPSAIPGQPDWMSMVFYQPAFDEAKEVIGISIAVMDVTDLKRAEESLRESKEHYRNMVDLSPQVLWTLDEKGNMLDISSRWAHMTGLSKEQTLRLGWLDALHPEDVLPTLKGLWDSVHTGKPIDIEYRLKVDGTWKWMRARGAPCFGPSGEITRWYGGVEDVDERKQLEQTLRTNCAQTKNSDCAP